MTNHNPASAHPNSSKLDRDILAKVNAHADRSIDRLFADIDELLSGDLSDQKTPHSLNRDPQPPRHTAELPRPSDWQPQIQPPQQPPIYPPPSDFVAPQPQSVEPQPPQPSTPQPRKLSVPLWMKAFLGIGITSIALSSLLLWLINERKIELPKNLDTSWLPFQSQSQISPDDAKFAEYMRKSISKIESANTQSTPATSPATPASQPVTTPVTQSAPTGLPATAIVANPTGTIATVPSAATTNAPQTPIALVKTLPTSGVPGAIFAVNNQNQTVNVGQKIGTSKWSLLTVAKGEVIIKKLGGEIRSIYVGQKF